MKRIAMIVTDVALPGEKGLGRMYYLAALLCKYGYEVDLITSRFQHWLKRFRTEEELQHPDAPCTISFQDELGYSKNIQLKRIFSRRILTRNVKKHLQANHYDLIYAQIPDNQLASTAARHAKKQGIPFIIDVEDLWPEAMRMVLDIPVISDILFSYFTVHARKAYRLADGVVGSSDRYRDQPKKYGVNVPLQATVYVGNELEEFDAGVREFSGEVVKPQGEFWVAYAGTLGTSYDIPTLIRAADLLKKEGRSQLRVMLLGDGPLRGDFEALAKELDAPVTFAGYMPYKKMAACLTASDIVVNSLVRKAAQSIVSKIGDYLASGKPMINTGMDEEFRRKVEADGFGVNVLPEDPQALADVIRSLMDDPAGCEAMGQTARKLAAEQFDRPHSYREIVRMADTLTQMPR